MVSFYGALRELWVKLVSTRPRLQPIINLKRDTRKHTRRLLISTAHICNFLASFKETCHLFRPQGGHLNILLAQEWGICSFQKKKWHTPRTGRGKYRWKAFPPVREVTPCVSNTTFQSRLMELRNKLFLYVMSSWWRLFLCGIGLIPFCLFARLFVCLLFFSILSAVFSMGLN